MEVYYFTILVLIIFSFIETRSKTPAEQKFFQKFYIIPFALIVLQIGLRWEMAPDWAMYADFFSILQKQYEPLRVEKGFLIVNFLFNKITHSYQIFILLQAFLLFYAVFKFYKKITYYPIIALLWFYCINLGLIGANRQLIAASIILLGLHYYLQNGKWYIYLLFVLLAVQFHNSAIFAVCYLLFNRVINNKIILVSLAICFILGNIGASDIVFSYATVLGDVAKDKVEAYSSETAIYSLNAILKRLIVLLPFLYFRNHISVDKKTLNFVFNGYFFGVCVYLLFAKTFGILATRGAFYFNLMEPVLISYYIYLFRNDLAKHLAIIVLFCLCVIVLRQSIVQYPEIFVPYKTQFFETGIINY